MALELRLTFSGLTALVPRKEASDPNPAQEWLVVMPALKGGDHLQLPKGGQEFSIAPHQALLMANAQAVRLRENEGTTKPIRLQLRDPKSAPNDEQSDLLFEINREVLEIGSGLKGLQVKSGTVAKETPNLQAPDQLHDIKWVPPINACLTTGVPLNRNLFDPNSLRPSSSLAGVVRLDRGVLETIGVHEGLNKAKQVAPVPYEFRRITSKGAPKGEPEVKPPLRQALAKGFRLRVRVQEEEASLILTDHLGNETRLVVGAYKGCPVNEDGEPIVEVKVFNQELEDILGFATAPQTSDEAKVDTGDTDFVIFYKLSPVWKTPNIKDLVIPYNASNGGGGSNKPCEPPQFPGIGG